MSRYIGNKDPHGWGCAIILLGFLGLFFIGVAADFLAEIGVPESLAVWVVIIGIVLFLLGKK